MTARGLRFVRMRYRRSGLSAAVVGLLSLAANATFAGPPGVEVSNLERAVSVVADRSPQHEVSGDGQALAQAVAYTVRE